MTFRALVQEQTSARLLIKLSPAEASGSMVAKQKRPAGGKVNTLPCRPLIPYFLSGERATASMGDKKSLSLSDSFSKKEKGFNVLVHLAEVEKTLQFQLNLDHVSNFRLVDG